MLKLLRIRTSLLFFISQGRTRIVEVSVSGEIYSTRHKAFHIFDSDSMGHQAASESVRCFLHSPTDLASRKTRT